MWRLETTVHAFLRPKPFRPFTVELTSDTSFTVDHPEALAVRGARAVFIDRRGRYWHFDEDAVVRVTTGRNGAS